MRKDEKTYDQIPMGKDEETYDKPSDSYEKRWEHLW